MTKMCAFCLNILKSMHHSQNQKQSIISSESEVRFNSFHFIYSMGSSGKDGRVWLKGIWRKVRVVGWCVIIEIDRNKTRASETDFHSNNNKSKNCKWIQHFSLNLWIIFFVLFKLSNVEHTNFNLNLNFLFSSLIQNQSQ